MFGARVATPTLPAPQGNPGLPRKDIQEALFGSLQSGFLEPFERDAKSAVDEELAISWLYLRRKRHQGQGSLGPNAAGEKTAEQ